VRPRSPEPEIAEDVSFRQLAKEARERLRSLTKENAERVGAHLVMAGRLLDIDPELAYQHTQAAVARAGRIDVVREAAGLAAYRTGRYAEALRELRTARRLNGSSEHLPIMADAERGLGRPDRAIALAGTPEADTLGPFGSVELAIVVSGARLDLGQPEAALAVLDRLAGLKGDAALRVLQARETALRAAGRGDEAAAMLDGIDPKDLERAAGDVIDEEVIVFDIYDDTQQTDDTEQTDGAGNTGKGAAPEVVDQAASESSDITQAGDE
jgi:tetratricopeptide (TPR) repeat protein